MQTAKNQLEKIPKNILAAKAHIKSNLRFNFLFSLSI